MESIGQKVSCIIPAYNEADRITNVLTAIKNHPMIEEIIVVNDGSTDETENIVHSHVANNLRLISLKKNQGKSHAVKIGIQEAKNDYILMLDADLKGLTAQNVSELILPVVDGHADLSLSLRGNSGLYRLPGLDFVSGERVFKKTLIENLDQLGSLKGYLIESYINKIIIQKKLKIKVVDWPKVEITKRAEKIGFFRGTTAELKMDADIISYLTLGGLLKMYFRMLNLRI
jgi:glycosyltransferase involved in cell wall biosynthesis